MQINPEASTQSQLNGSLASLVLSTVTRYHLLYRLQSTLLRKDSLTFHLFCLRTLFKVMSLHRPSSLALVVSS